MWGVCLLGMLIFSCSDVDTESSTIDKDGKPTLSFNMTRSPQDIINNTEVYLFDHDNVTPANNWQFVQKAVGVTHGTNQLSMNIEAKKWNIALATAETNISSDIISPRRGDARTGLMWETTPVSGALPSMPELRTAYLDAVNVLPNTTNTAGPATLFRNVAWVKVVIDKTRGLDPAGEHKFELNNVPTKLSWDGKLYPSAAAPTVSASPMKGTFTIGAKATEPDLQESDTLYFVVPAHKGSDYLSSVSAIDTVVPRLNFSVDLALAGTTDRYKKVNIDIPRVPRVNHILLVKLSMLTAVEVSADILDWVDVNQNADLNQTELLLDRAEVGLAYRDTLLVNTNASSFTVTKDPAATWLTVTPVGNTVLLEADVNTYVDNSPRSSFITIKANNVEKKVPVTQRPDRGTISVDTKEMFLSPPNPTKSLNVTSVGGNWKIIGSTLKANPSVTTGNKGTSSVSFTRTSTGDEDYFSRVFGDTIVVFKNQITLDTDTVKISNLYIHVDDDVIEINHVEHSDVSGVKVFGGNLKGLNITAKPSWVYGDPDSYYNTSTNELHLRCTLDPEKDERWGSMTLQHKDDPSYVKTVQIVQDIIVEIPEFDYYSVKFTWVNNDVDIRCGFTGNSGTVIVNGDSYTLTVPFDNKYVGYAQGSSVDYNSSVLIKWAGDATGGQGENFFFNAPMINAPAYPGQYGVTPSTPNLLPRKLILSIGATWYTDRVDTSPYIDRRGGEVTCTVAAYHGGGYSQSGTNFNFTGTYVYGENKTYNVYSGYHFDTTKHPQYFEFCTIEYDRKKHTARVRWANPQAPLTRAVASQMNVVPSSVLVEKELEKK